MLSGWATFASGTSSVEVRVGVSFISVEQARWNLDNEIPDGTTLEQTAKATRSAWAEKLDRIQVRGASDDDPATFYTAVFHTLQVSSPRNFLRFWLRETRSTRTSKMRTASTTPATTSRLTRDRRIMGT
jgi:putative alpha-1,2-mannosidase